MNKSGWIAVGIVCVLGWTGCKPSPQVSPPPPPPPSPTQNTTKVALRPVASEVKNPPKRPAPAKGTSDDTSDLGMGLNNSLPSISLKKTTFGTLDKGKPSGLGGGLGIKPFSAKDSKETFGVGGLKLGSGGSGTFNLNKPAFGGGKDFQFKDDFGDVTRKQKNALGTSPTSQPARKPTSRPVPQRKLPALRVVPKKQIPTPRVMPKVQNPPIRPRPRVIVPLAKTRPGLRSILQVPSVASSILANVNNEPVFKSDFLWALMLHKNIWEKKNGPLLREHLSTFRKKVLERVIDEYLVFQRAIQKGIRLTPKDKRRGTQMFRARIRGMNLGHAMKYARINPAQFRQILNRQLYLEKYKLELAKGVKITAGMVREYYKKTTGVAQVRASQIVVDIPEHATEEQVATALANANKIAGMLKQPGVKIRTVAALVSGPAWHATFGDLGVVKTGDTIKTIEDALFSLQKGQVGGPIRTAIGFHVLKVHARRAPRPFALVQTKILQMLYQRKLMILLQAEAAELRKEAQIEVLVKWGKD